MLVFSPVSPFLYALRKAPDHQTLANPEKRSSPRGQPTGIRWLKWACRRSAVHAFGAADEWSRTDPGDAGMPEFKLRNIGRTVRPGDWG